MEISAGGGSGKTKPIQSQFPQKAKMSAKPIFTRSYGDQRRISGRTGGYRWDGQIQNGRLSARSAYGQHFELDKLVRKSPKEGLKPPPGAIVLLPFKEGVKPDMSAWTNRQWKALDSGTMIARSCAAPLTGPGQGNHPEAIDESDEYERMCETSLTLPCSSQLGGLRIRIALKKVRVMIVTYDGHSQTLETMKNPCCLAIGFVDSIARGRMIWARVLTPTARMIGSGAMCDRTTTDSKEK